MKIKPQDLRIGNVLTYLSSEGPMYCRVDVQDLQWLCDNPKDFNEKHQVVELTEELLIKLGFVCEYKSDFHSLYFKDDISYYFWYATKRHYASIQGYEVKCDYLHNLQNVTFVIKVNELNVSELFTS